ncbi:hypothetical protein SCOR_09075 [Sulfidibacter corallicola]
MAHYSDGDLSLISPLGLRHKGGDPFTGGDIARPARLLVDREGRILWSNVAENYRVRPKPKTILEEIEPLLTSTR